MNDTLPMKVNLAGFNIDRDTLTELVESAYGTDPPPPEECITPETISAAYARISRNPASVPEIRSLARKDVEKARRSNRRIIFGLGHASVAEHAVFNFDVTGISRLAVEAVEHHRLASFTEKSQRYIKLDGDYVIPPELQSSPLENEFHELIKNQNDAYKLLYPDLLEYFKDIVEESNEELEKGPAESRASEDARYVVSLATQTQFGMTINARTLEIMSRACLAHKNQEVIRFGDLLRRAVEGIAPSLVKYVLTTEYERKIAESTAYWPGIVQQTETSEFEDVRLVHFDEKNEERVLSALHFRMNGGSYSEAVETTGKMSSEDKLKLVCDTLSSNAAWDPATREFELSTFTFELCLSSTAFAQLKRHRMASIISGPYNPALGWTIPDSISQVGKEKEFKKIMSLSDKVAGKIAEVSPQAAAYALTNAHRRRVLFSANARELQHFSRLRQDIHAQWDIRQLADKIVKLAKEKAPVLMLLSCGKHDFKKVHQEIYGDGEDTDQA